MSKYIVAIAALLLCLGWITSAHSATPDPNAGRLAIIDGRAGPDQFRENSTRKHTIGPAQVREEVSASGFVFRGEEPGFWDPDYDKPMFFLIFRKQD